MERFDLSAFEQGNIKTPIKTGVSICKPAHPEVQRFLLHFRDDVRGEILQLQGKIGQRIFCRINDSPVRRSAQLLFDTEQRTVCILLCAENPSLGTVSRPHKLRVVAFFSAQPSTAQQIHRHILGWKRGLGVDHAAQCGQQQLLSVNAVAAASTAQITREHSPQIGSKRGVLAARHCRRQLRDIRAVNRLLGSDNRLA